MSGTFHIGKKVKYLGPLLEQIAPGQAEAIGTVIDDPQHPNERAFVLYVPVRFDPPYGNSTYPPSAGRWYINPLHEGTTLEELR